MTSQSLRIKQSRELSLKGLRELKKRHQLLGHYIQEIDFVFSFVVFLWYILVVVSFCIKVNTIIAGEYSSANIEGWVSSIWSIGITILIYIGVTLSASFVNYESIQSALNHRKTGHFSNDQIWGKFLLRIIAVFDSSWCRPDCSDLLSISLQLKSF